MRAQHTNVMSFVVAASREATYEYFADLRNIPEYDAPIRSVTPVTPEGWSGNRFALRFAPLGAPSFPVELEVLERRPAERLHYVITGNRSVADDLLEFSDTPAGTRVTIRARLELRGLLAPAMPGFRLLSPLLTRAMARIIARTATKACASASAS